MGKINGLHATTYVFHCDKCHRMVKKDDLDANPEMPCPPEAGPDNRLNQMLKNGEAPYMTLPDYKKGENYPQVAPNLPGDGVVHSYDDYKRKCKACGIAEVGASAESRYRNKCRKKKGTNKDGTWDVRADRLRKVGFDIDGCRD